jgi:hypothetical protein
MRLARMQRAAMCSRRVVLLAAKAKTPAVIRGCVPPAWCAFSTQSNTRAPADDDGSFVDPRPRIMDAALNHVHEEGWSQDALAAGAKDCGYVAKQTQWEGETIHLISSFPVAKMFIPLLRFFLGQLPYSGAGHVSKRFHRSCVCFHEER